MLLIYLFTKVVGFPLGFHCGLLHYIFSLFTFLVYLHIFYSSHQQFSTQKSLLSMITLFFPCVLLQQLNVVNVKTTNKSTTVEVNPPKQAELGFLLTLGNITDYLEIGFTCTGTEHWPRPKSLSNENMKAVKLCRNLETNHPEHKSKSLDTKKINQESSKRLVKLLKNLKSGKIIQ